MPKTREIRKNILTKDMQSLLQQLANAKSEQKKRLAAEILVVTGYIHNTPTARFNWIEDRPSGRMY